MKVKVLYRLLLPLAGLVAIVSLTFTAYLFRRHRNARAHHSVMKVLFVDYDYTTMIIVTCYWKSSPGLVNSREAGTRMQKTGTGMEGAWCLIQKITFLSKFFLIYVTMTWSKNRWGWEIHPKVFPHNCLVSSFIR